ARLATFALLLSARGVGEDRCRGGEDRSALGLDAIERARRGEAFELSAVEQPRIDPRGKILEAGEWAASFPFLDQRFHRLLAYALERPEGVADGPVFDREEGGAGVDVGGQALDPATPHVLDEHSE